MAITLGSAMSGELLSQIGDSFSWLAFDCYGTLVDWETGVRSAIREIAGVADPALFYAYLEIEAEVEREAYQSYRAVLAEVLQRLGRRFKFSVASEQADHFAATLPSWPLWPDTNGALERLKQRFRLGVLSNIDRDLFAETAEQFSVDMDLLVTAEDVCSYKPKHGHFLKMLAKVGGDATGVLHCAQSLFHDCAPATQLGIPNIWINRRSETNTSSAEPLAEFADLSQLADALGV